MAGTYATRVGLSWLALLAGGCFTAAGAVSGLLHPKYERVPLPPYAVAADWDSHTRMEHARAEAIAGRCDTVRATLSELEHREARFVRSALAYDVDIQRCIGWATERRDGSYALHGAVVGLLLDVAVLAFVAWDCRQPGVSCVGDDVE